MPLSRRRIIGPSFPYLAVPYTVGGGAPSSSNKWDATKVAVNSSVDGTGLIFTNNGGNFGNVLAIDGASTGKLFWQVVATIAGGICEIGFGNASTDISVGTFLGSDNNAIAWASDTNIYRAGGVVASIMGFTQGDLLSMAVDFTASPILMWARVGTGNWNNSGTANPATGVGGISAAGINAGPYYAAAGLNTTGDKLTAQFIATPIPSGFSLWP